MTPTDEVDRGYMYLDHRLSTDANCGGEKLAKPSKLLGSIYKSQESGTIPLYEFFIDAPGTDHAYSVNIDEYDGKNGYQLASSGNPIGYVYPAK